MSFEIVNQEFKNLGYILVEIPESLKQELLVEANEIQQDFSKAIPRRHTLAGHLEHEYSLPKSANSLEKFVIDLSLYYNHCYNNFEMADLMTQGVPLAMRDPWINFQSKYEFNPVHRHRGLMSFVIWLKIPYDLEYELANGPGRHTDKKLNSTFNFLYTNSEGTIQPHTINVDKSFEGKMILFPAKMMHCVYPFYTSDDYRISVAGNVMLNTDSVAPKIQ